MSGLEPLLEIMARLRDPDTGCPWDLEQDFVSIAPYTLEEAYEVDDAIRRQDWPGLCDELGDLLLQVVFHAQMAQEASLFGFPDVVEAICAKLIRRHPHVFGDATIPDAEAQTRSWDAIKAEERARRADAAGTPNGVLDGVPLAMPALARTAALLRRAARAGFAFEAPPSDFHGTTAAEIGERLFGCVARASQLGIDAEEALRDHNARFEVRFGRGEDG